MQVQLKNRQIDRSGVGLPAAQPTLAGKPGDALGRGWAPYQPSARARRAKFAGNLGSKKQLDSTGERLTDDRPRLCWKPSQLHPAGADSVGCDHLSQALFMSGENRWASFTVGPRTVMCRSAILMLFAALAAAAALGYLTNSAWATPIRDLESGPDTRPRMLIQFPKLILGAAGDSQHNASGSPSPTADQDAAKDYEVALGDTRLAAVRSAAARRAAAHSAGGPRAKIPRSSRQPDG